MSEPAPEIEQRNAGVRVPPPLIYLGTLVVGLAINLAFPSLLISAWLPLDTLARSIIGVGLFLAGMFIGGAGIAGFKEAGTEVKPWLPSTALVTSGVYRFTRNPMYLGLSLCYAALSILADSLVALALLVPLVLVMTYAVIRREERYLEVTFGDAYREYKSRVRRWF